MCTLCLLVLLLAVQHHIRLTSTESAERWKCPNGWLLKLGSCYRWGTSQMIYSQAKAQCEDWGSRLWVIKNEEENKLFAVQSNGNSYWVGIESSDNGWMYQEKGEIHYITFRAFQTSGSQRYARNYNNYGYCVKWHSSSMIWEAEACSRYTRLFICQLQADCTSGRFGVNCSQECHCKGEVCNTTSGICNQGCQLGWTGTSCNKEKLKAEAKFYCFKINGDKVMTFRVNQRGTRYRFVSAMDKNGNAVEKCTKSNFSHFEAGGVATLKLTEQKNGRYKPECGEHKVSEDEVTWRFKFLEFPMTSSAYDILFEMTCDFTKADSLHRLVTSNTEKSSNKTTTLTESRVSVSFDILDPFNDQPVTTVKLGQQIKLQVKLNNGDDFGVTAISPYNCSVSTLDGSHSVIFLDEHGYLMPFCITPLHGVMRNSTRKLCASEDAQVVFPSTDLTRWRSDVFEAFTFEGYDKINFQCSFHVCFSEQHHYCQDMCTHSKKRKTRKLRKRNRSRKRIGTIVGIDT